MGALLIYILVVAMFPLLGYFFDYRSMGRKEEYTRKVFNEYFTVGLKIGTVITIILICALVSLSGKVLKFGPSVDCVKQSTNIPIVSVFRDKSYTSSFILGTGGGTSVTKYYTYISLPQGLKLIDFSVATTYIVEDDDAPHFERFDYMCPKTVKHWLLSTPLEMRYNVGKEGRLHVPPGTIMRSFKL